LALERGPGLQERLQASSVVFGEADRGPGAGGLDQGGVLAVALGGDVAQEEALDALGDGGLQAQEVLAPSAGA
jgi:hypothetical protein